MSIEYQYWAYKNGDTYAVEIHAGCVVGACGPLYRSERPADMRDFEYDREDGEWVQAHMGAFRLEVNIR